ncbi:MAG: ATP-dependent helicase, partial [Bacteroidota bacterium]
VPGDGEDYVHRIGRTARADGDGAAFTLIGEKEQNKFAAIEQLLEKEVEKAPVPKELGEAPAYHPRMRSGHSGHSGHQGNRGPQKKFHRGAPRRR